MSAKFYKARESNLGHRKLGTHAPKKKAIYTVSALVCAPIFATFLFSQSPFFFFFFFFFFYLSGKKWQWKSRPQKEKNFHIAHFLKEKNKNKKQKKSKQKENAFHIAFLSNEMYV